VSVALSNKQAQHDAAVLAQVKEALIGWSAARTPTVASPNIRPGELPCPDATNSGNDPGPTCSAGAIGRVPWKSLGIPEPRDSAGETLWYAISGPFRHYGAGYTDPITSDTMGNLTVYLGSNATTMTSQAVAVIFAPGAALAAQDRNPSTTALCATTGTTISRDLCAANYLEATGGGNNAQTGGPFIQARSSSSFNDRVLAITNADLMPAVEQRVAKEIMSRLESYRIATGAYPFASISNGASAVDHNRHRFPCDNAGTLPTRWTDAGITLPNWLTNGCDCTGATKGWPCVVFYAVAKNRLPGSSCSICASTTTTCGSTTTSTTSLTVANTNAQIAHLCATGSSPFTCNPAVLTTGTADLLLITPGAYAGSPARSWPTTISAISGYFEDPQNSDNDDFNCFFVPTSTAHNRDRIYVVR
jgi:hypothetical protein